METQKIGLAAHVGTDAHIQDEVFNSTEFMVGFLVASLLFFIFLGIAYYTWKYYQNKRKNKTKLTFKPILDDTEQLDDQSSTISEQQIQNNKYLPSNKKSTKFGIN